MCAHPDGIKRSGKVASPPWQTGCWVYSLPSQSMLMMDSEASLFRTGFVCRRRLKEKNKRTGSDGPLPRSFFGNNGRRCPFFLSQLIGRTCCLIALQLADQTHL